MRARVLRGVCIGVGRNAKAGDLVDDLSPGTLRFLESINAVEILDDDPVVEGEEKQDAQKPEKPQDEKPAVESKPESKPAAKKKGRKTED